jgi:hypothetical protein
VLGESKKTIEVWSDRQALPVLEDPKVSKRPLDLPPSLPIDFNGYGLYAELWLRD